jgi:hypothetical protein
MLQRILPPDGPLHSNLSRRTSTVSLIAHHTGFIVIRHGVESYLQAPDVIAAAFAYAL